MNTRLAVLVLAVVSLLALSPTSKADTFLYNFTALITPEIGSPYTVNIQFDLTATTLPSSGDATSFTSVSDPDGGTVTNFQWNSAASGTCEMGSFGGMACAGFQDTVNGIFAAAFPGGDFLTTNTFNGADASLVITDISTAAEPPLVWLLALGLIGLLAVRVGGRCLSRLVPRSAS
jgi:hypothetical protein